MPSDELWMNEALQEALAARTENEVPIGAVVVCGDHVVGRGHNRTISDNDPLALAGMSIGSVRRTSSPR